jgi:hypothetical protein
VRTLEARSHRTTAGRCARRCSSWEGKKRGSEHGKRQPLFDAAGRFLGYSGTGRDVTAQVRADADSLVVKK